jgi:hypothetical protein
MCTAPASPPERAVEIVERRSGRRRRRERPLEHAPEIRRLLLLWKLLRAEQRRRTHR